jgi:hypothetical protein
MASQIPKFSDYGRDDSQKVGTAFVDAFREHRDALNRQRFATAEWTNCVLDWFANTAPVGVRVDATRSPPLPREPVPATSAAEILRQIAGTPRASQGEFLFDLCHSTWPANSMPDYWNVSLRALPVLRLALESESGKETSSGGNMGAIMEDATKLLHVTSDAKVMVFASRNVEERGTILSLAGLLQAADQNVKTPWLWLDLPWATWTERHQPDGWLFHELPTGAKPLSIVHSRTSAM